MTNPQLGGTQCCGPERHDCGPQLDAPDTRGPTLAKTPTKMIVDLAWVPA